jgi:hypothetical protein
VLDAAGDEEGDEAGDEAGGDAADDDDAAGVPDAVRTDAELAGEEPLLHPATRAATRATPGSNALASTVCRFCLADVIHRILSQFVQP